MTWQMFWQQPHLRKRMLLATGLVFILLIGAAASNLAQQAQNRVKAIPAFQIEASDLRVEDLPLWLQAYTSEIAPAGKIDSGSLNIFSPNLLQDVAAAYLGNPWVAAVREISKKYPNRISVRLSLRHPVAWVAQESGYFLVDGNGICLPVQKSLDNFSDALPVVRGVESKVPTPGRQWQDSSLLAALHIVQFLANHLHSLDSFVIAELVIEKGFQAKPVMVLKTQQPDFRIVWGSSLEQRFPPISPKQRLQALLHLQQIFVGQESAISDFEEADLRFGYVILRTKTKDKRCKLSRNGKRDNKT